MIQIIFKNLKKSEQIRDIVLGRVKTLVDKFDDLRGSKITVTLEMENSLLQAGPDLFSVKLHIFKGRFGGITVSKSDPNLYRAVADLIDHMLEKLNRYGDKERVKKRRKARQLVEKQAFPAFESEIDNELEYDREHDIYRISS